MVIRLYLNNLPRMFVRQGTSITFQFNGDNLEVERGSNLIIWWGDKESNPPEGYKEVRLVII